MHLCSEWSLLCLPLLSCWDSDVAVMWINYLKILRQVAVVDLNQRLFSENTARRPLAAGLFCLGASLE